MMETDTERLSNNLAGWTLTSITATEVKLALKFIEPIKVSQGDEFESILVFAGLGSFEDKDGLHLPEFDFLKEEIPRQNSSAEEIAKVQAAGATTSAATTTVTGSSFLINLLFTGSMNSLWSALNAV